MRNSDGSYATPVTYGLNGRVSQIATGDLNGDGRPDIVALLPDQNAVAVLINNGDGTFTRGANLIVGHGIGSLLLGDFSGDGKLDLAVTVNGDPDPTTGLYPNAGVALALGNGDGTFAAPVLTSAGASPSGTFGHALAAGDVNHDGKLDLVVIATGLASPDFRQGGVFVLLGNGNGTFQAGPTYLTVNDYFQNVSNDLHYAAPQSVALGDFDGDGKLDMAVSIGPYIFVMAGNGDGTFRHASPKTNDVIKLLPFQGSNTLGGPFDISVADLNGDGRADIVATNGGASLATMVATADPFAEHAVLGHRLLCDIFGWASRAYHRRRQRDGVRDVVIAENAAGLLGIITGVGDGTLNASPGTFTQIGQVTQLLPVDANGDGKLDIIATAFVSNGNVGLLVNRGNGTFDVSAAAVPNPVVAAGVSSAGHPGRVDVVTVDLFGTIESIPILSNGKLGQAVQIGSPFTGVTSGVAGDFNHDAGSTSRSARRPPPTRAASRCCSATATARCDAAVDRSWRWRSGDRAADFNGGGNLDLAVSHGELKFDSTTNTNSFVGLDLLLGKGDGPSRRR